MHKNTGIEGHQKLCSSSNRVILSTLTLVNDFVLK